MRPRLPARIILSAEMVRQNHKTPKLIFPDKTQAYVWGMSKWGSGLFSGEGDVVDMWYAGGWGIEELSPKRIKELKGYKKTGNISPIRKLLY